jgi:hypothetical protein
VPRHPVAGRVEERPGTVQEVAPEHAGEEVHGLVEVRHCEADVIYASCPRDAVSRSARAWESDVAPLR